MLRHDTCDCFQGVIIIHMLRHDTCDCFQGVIIFGGMSSWPRFFKSVPYIVQQVVTIDRAWLPVLLRTLIIVRVLLRSSPPVCQEGNSFLELSVVSASTLFDCEKTATDKLLTTVVRCGAQSLQPPIKGKKTHTHTYTQIIITIG